VRNELEVLVLGKESVVSIIQHSPNLKSQFHLFVQANRQTVGKAIRDMGYAKHRYNSIQKPLGRWVLHFDSVCSLANWVRQHRRGRSEGAHCESFLSCVTEESYVQLAMVADAADEVGVLLRFLDDENHDLAQAPEEVFSFAQRARFLFSEDGCLEVPGYTAFALEEVRRVRIFNLRDGIRRFGCPAGLPDLILNRCLGRMKACSSSSIVRYSAPTAGRRPGLLPRRAVWEIVWKTRTNDCLTLDSLDVL
jgi:hypothetical protein